MTATVDGVYTADERLLLEGRWQMADRSLRNARGRVEIAVSTLDCLVASRDVIEAMIQRWIRETFDELDRLDLASERPRGDR